MQIMHSGTTQVDSGHLVCINSVSDLAWLPWWGLFPIFALLDMDLYFYYLYWEPQTVVMVKPLKHKQAECFFFPSATCSNVLFIISFWLILILFVMLSTFLSVESHRFGRSSSLRLKILLRKYFNPKQLTFGEQVQTHVIWTPKCRWLSLKAKRGQEKKKKGQAAWGEHKELKKHPFWFF